MPAISLILAVLLSSFLITSAVIVPFINTLYALRFQRLKQETRDVFGVLTPIFDRFHNKKAGVPVGGGLLIILVVSILFAIIIPLCKQFGIQVTSVYTNAAAEINILFLTFIGFGLLGLYDDVRKFFKIESTGFFGLRMKHKLLLEVMLATIIAAMMYFQLGIEIVNIPFIGTFTVGYWFIPFAAFTIVSFSNAINITDGLDGLAAGLMMISLFGLWVLSASILDVPLSLFIGLLLGSIISFLYFNVYPARIFMGDVGSLSLGATLAVIGLLLGKVAALVVIGGIFVLEVSSSLIQLLSKRYRKKKVFPAAPFHLTLQQMGWEEPKIVQRAYLVQIMLTVFGLWLALL